MTKNIGNVDRNGMNEFKEKFSQLYPGWTNDQYEQLAEAMRVLRMTGVDGETAVTVMLTMVKVAIEGERTRKEQP